MNGASTARRAEIGLATAALLVGAIAFAAAPSPMELAVTIGVEAPIVWAMGIVLDLDRWRAVMLCVFANILTQPVFYLALSRLPSGGAQAWQAAFAAGEVVIWLVEALIYFVFIAELRGRGAGLAKAFLISLAANATSAIFGLMLPV